MLDMDEVHHIRQKYNQGYSVSALAKETGHCRATIRRAIHSPIKINSPFKERRNCRSAQLRDFVCSKLEAELSVTHPKSKLTARRLYALLLEHIEQHPEVPFVSERTFCRLVKRVRGNLGIRQEAFLDLVKAPGEAQLDFTEVCLIHEGKTIKHDLLLLTFPYSNARWAYLLPAHNFECLGHALNRLFAEIGRVPSRIRCDNMSTAISKVVKPNDRNVSGELIWDADNHPRVLTDSFRRFMVHYGFIADFCNRAQGHEKGSVENAAGWSRRNFFVPILRFDGDYDALNQRLLQYCRDAMDKAHYLHSDESIAERFAYDRAAMLALPRNEFEACSWEMRRVSKYGRVRLEGNEYATDAAPGDCVYLKKLHNQVVIFDDDRTEIGRYVRCYENGKTFINWVVELRHLKIKPMAFKDSLLSKMLSNDVASALRYLCANERRIVLEVMYELLDKGESINRVLERLASAVNRSDCRNADDIVCRMRAHKQENIDQKQEMQLPEHCNFRVDVPCLPNFGYGGRYAC